MNRKFRDLSSDSSTDDNSTADKEEDETIVEVGVDKNDVIKNNPEPEAQKLPKEEILKELYFEDHSQPCNCKKRFFLETVKMQSP